MHVHVHVSALQVVDSVSRCVKQLIDFVHVVSFFESVRTNLCSSYVIA